MKRLILLALMLTGLLWAQNMDPKATLVRINEKTYTVAEYDKILTDYFKHYKPKTVEEEAKYNDQCFEELIGRYVYDKAIKAGKSKLTDAQVLAEAKRNVPAAVKGIPDLQTNGKFDKKKFEDALKTAPPFKKMVIEHVRGYYQYTKLLDDIKAEVEVDADSVKTQWIKDNDSLDASIIFFDYNRMHNVNASEEEARTFYAEHREEYRREDGRDLRYVKFSSAPSAADSLAAKAKADSVYEQLMAGADFAEMAANYSDDTSNAQSGGELGWFGKGRMVPPFEEAAFNTPVGSISRPAESGFGWHIIKVTGEREGTQGPEIEAAHILIRPFASKESLQALKANSAALHELAQEKGLIEAAESLGYELQTTPVFFAQDGFIPQIGRDSVLLNFAFKNPPNSLANIFFSPSGDAYVIETANEYPEWYPTFEEQKQSFIARATSAKRMYHTHQMAKNYLNNLEPSMYLAQAERDSLNIIEITDHHLDKPISMIGKIDELNQALFETAEGEFTGLVEHNNRWFLARINKRTRPDLTVWDKQKTQIIKEANDKYKQDHLNKWYLNERKQLNIIDNRADQYDLSSLRKAIRL
ncbi:MAG TPA: peptidylprolyl isomerase [Candidatus Cloacimonadota bacterium]|nr:peptidylprolyl isomerase [Candidatus Cloacimonadota bacterium]